MLYSRCENWAIIRYSFLYAQASQLRAAVVNKDPINCFTSQFIQAVGRVAHCCRYLVALEKECTRHAGVYIHRNNS